MTVSLKKRPIPPNNLAQLRMERRLSMQELGEMIGKDASYINKLEKRAQGIPLDILQRLARALAVAISDIVDDESGAPSPQLTRQAAPYVPVGERRMIPIYGTAAGSHLQGAQQQLEGPIDMVEAPRALENARGLYGIYVVGHSMEPMFRQGALVIVNSHKPPRTGDAVVVQEQKSEASPSEVTIGILERQTPDKLVLRKLNPFSTIEVNSRYVTHVHKVLDHGELLGFA